MIIGCVALVATISLDSFPGRIRDMARAAGLELTSVCAHAKPGQPRAIRHSSHNQNHEPCLNFEPSRLTQ